MNLTASGVGDFHPQNDNSLNSTNCNPIAFAPIQIGNRLVVTYPSAQGKRALPHGKMLPGNIKIANAISVFELTR